MDKKLEDILSDIQELKEALLPIPLKIFRIINRFQTFDINQYMNSNYTEKNAMDALKPTKAFIVARVNNVYSITHCLSGCFMDIIKHSPLELATRMENQNIGYKKATTLLENMAIWASKVRGSKSPKEVEKLINSSFDKPNFLICASVLSGFDGIFQRLINSLFDIERRLINLSHQPDLSKDYTMLADSVFTLKAILPNLLEEIEDISSSIESISKKETNTERLNTIYPVNNCFDEALNRLSDYNGILDSLDKRYIRRDTYSPESTVPNYECFIDSCFFDAVNTFESRASRFIIAAESLKTASYLGSDIEPSNLIRVMSDVIRPIDESRTFTINDLRYTITRCNRAILGMRLDSKNTKSDKVLYSLVINILINQLDRIHKAWAESPEMRWEERG